MSGSTGWAPAVLPAALTRLLAHSSPVARQTAFIFLADGAANLLDYGFHIYLGRSLPPQDFAVVQTINAALLIILTAAGVWQPVVARFVAEGASRAGQDGRPLATAAPTFQHYFRLAIIVGIALTLMSWLAREAIGGGLNVPSVAVVVAAAILIAGLARPVVAGVLQGQQRFVAFGLTRSAFAAGRLLLALILVGALGGGALAAVATMPLGAIFALVLGLAFLGRAVWQPGPALSVATRRLGWRLSAGALLAYVSYMALLNVDLIWVNRFFEAEVAADYATAVLLRRVISLLPGAVIVVVYPRIAALAEQGRSLDQTLFKASVAIATTSLSISALYFALGRPIIGLSFGADYLSAGPLLGWLGLGMTGYALAAMWMNTFLATRPAPFIGLLLATTVAQVGLFAWRHNTIAEIMGIFGAAGWFLAGAGMILYMAWLRPRTASAAVEQTDR